MIFRISSFKALALSSLYSLREMPLGRSTKFEGVRDPYKLIKVIKDGEFSEEMNVAATVGKD